MELNGLAARTEEVAFHDLGHTRLSCSRRPLQHNETTLLQEMVNTGCRDGREEIGTQPTVKLVIFVLRPLEWPPAAFEGIQIHERLHNQPRLGWIVRWHRCG